MSSLISKNRVSVCLFTFADGRRCRTPRNGSHPHFCFYHARKESQARAAENLGKDLSYFFSGDFVTACDLSTALARLLPAVARGDIKLRTATTLAYMAQTFLQTVHLSQKEFIAAVGETEWRKTVCDHINQNFRHLNSPPHDSKAPDDAEDTPPPSPAPTPQPSPTPAPTEACHPERREGSSPASAPATVSAPPLDSPSPQPPTHPLPHLAAPSVAESETPRLTPLIPTFTKRLATD